MLGTPVRRGLAALAAAAIVAVLPGLGAAQDEAVTLRVWTVNNSNIPEFYAEAGRRFAELHPEVEVVWEGFPNEAFKTAIQVALAGSEPPDIFEGYGEETAFRQVRDGVVADITDFGGLEGGFASTLSPGWLRSFEVDGRIYGVPLSALSKFFYYKEPFFAEHGLEVPATMGELAQLCRDIRAIDPAITPWPMGNSERWKIQHLLAVVNARVVGEDQIYQDYQLLSAPEALFADPGYVEALRLILGFQEAGCFQEAPNATSPEASRSLFAVTDAPMIYCGTWCPARFVDEGLDADTLGLFALPPAEGGRGDPASNFLLANGLMVAEASPNHEMAARFLSFLVTDEMAKLYAEMTGDIPSNPALVDEIETMLPIQREAVRAIAGFSRGLTVLDIRDAEVYDAYLNAGTDLLNGTKTPEEIMQGIRDLALAAQASL